MIDKIKIEGLEITCIIGTLPRERKNPQKIFLDMEFPAPVRKAALKDDLRDTVNYQKISIRAGSFAKQSKFYLIETLAERLARTLMREFHLKSLRLRVSKPTAIAAAKKVAVEIFRKS